MASARPALRAVIEAVYAAAVQPRKWPETLGLMAEHTGGNGAMLVFNAPAEGRAAIVTGRLREDLSALYLTSSAYIDNPWVTALADVTPGVPAIASHHVDPAVMRRTLVHADLLLPQGIVDLAVVTHPAMARGHASGGFGVTFCQRGAEHTREAAQRLGRLAPHLHRALEVSLNLAPHAGGSAQLEAVLQAMPGAALLLDAAGCLVFANAAAEILLRNQDGITVEPRGGMRLVAAVAPETRLLARHLADVLACAGQQGEDLSGPIRLSRPSGRAPLLLLAVPLPPPAFPIWTMTGSPRALVLITDPEAEPRVRAEALRAALGLTPAEARVALLIAAGVGVPQAASALGVSTATVKTQLAQCFDKTGLHSQVALARLVNALPAPGAGAHSTRRPPAPPEAGVPETGQESPGPRAGKP